MAEMMTIKEAAARWGITERRVNALCKDGRISGAYKSADPEAFLRQQECASVHHSCRLR